MGNKKRYFINGQVIEIESKLFVGKKSKAYYEHKLYKTFQKIGVLKRDLSLNLLNDKDLRVEWRINEHKFSFISASQDSLRKNFGVAAQAIEEDVRQILRGIKDISLTLKQYADNFNSNIVVDSFENSNSLKAFFNNKTEQFSPKSLALFTNLDEKDLDSKYLPLLKKTPTELKTLYMNFKEKCLKENYQDHEFLKALHIILKKKNIKI